MEQLLHHPQVALKFRLVLMLTCTKVGAMVSAKCSRSLAAAQRSSAAAIRAASVSSQVSLRHNDVSFGSPLQKLILEAMASNLLAMASNLLAMVSNLLAMVSNLLAMASNLEAMASNLIASLVASAKTHPSGPHV